MIKSLLQKIGIAKKRSVKPFFSNKSLNSKRVMLVVKNEIVSDGRKIATIMNKYFNDINKHVNLRADKISHREKLVNVLDTFIYDDSLQRINLADFHYK